jgi:hypothetical protein
MKKNQQDSFWVYGVIGIILLFLLFGPPHWYNRWTYSDSVKSAFITTCTMNGSVYGYADEGFCKCLLNKIMDSYSYSEQQKINLTQSGLNEFQQACTGK